MRVPTKIIGSNNYCAIIAVKVVVYDVSKFVIFIILSTIKKALIGGLGLVFPKPPNISPRDFIDENIDKNQDV